jgi:pilus assembly protein CpaF
MMQKTELYQRTLEHFLAPIWHFINDESVSEIMVNGPHRVYVERRGRIEATDCGFSDDAALLAAIRNIAEFVGRPIDRNHHSVDARLPDGSRVHAIIPPSSRVGICLTIRRFQQSAFDLRQLISCGSLSEQAAEFLSLCVMLHKNIIISGGTGTGKTSMLNALSTAIPENERIIVIEDSSELQLRQPHTVYLESQPPAPDGQGGVTIRDLFVDSLRMRPDRIVVGEVRRGEALDLIQSMISGHAGSMSTVHANTPRDAASRLETLCLMSDTNLPVHVARAQVASAVHLVLQLARFSDGSRRVTQISESLGLDERDGYTWRDLFMFRGNGRNADGGIRGELTATGERPGFSSEPFQFGLDHEIRTTSDLFRAATAASASPSRK